MNKSLTMAAILSLISGGAYAQCTAPPGTLLDAAGIQGAFEGMVVEADNPAGTEKWTELHGPLPAAGVNLFELGDPAGPEALGTWDVLDVDNTGGAPDQVCYNYVGGDTFCWAVYAVGTGGPYEFCDGGGGLIATTVSVTAAPAP